MNLIQESVYPRVEIHPVVQAMHEYFEVDAEQVGWVLARQKLSRCAIQNFFVAVDLFEETDDNPDLDTAGLYIAGEQGVHLFAGDVDLPSYFPDELQVAHPTELEDPFAFTSVLLHEIGHYTDWLDNGGRFGGSTDEDAEIIADKFALRYLDQVGELVRYKLKESFVDGQGVSNLYCEIFDLPEMIVTSRTIRGNSVIHTYLEKLQYV